MGGPEMGEKVKNLTSWFVLAALVLVTLPGCGKEEEDPLRVSVQIPSGEASELFWFGVEQKVLQVNRNGDLSSQPWAPGQASNLGLKEGDGLVFLGSDSGGRVLVSGEAKVGKAKMVTILLRRVL